MARAIERLAVNAVPGRAQRQAVIDSGTFENFSYGVGADALNFVAAGEILVVRPHVERREVIGLQDDFVVVRQLGMGNADAGKQNTEQ